MTDDEVKTWLSKEERWAFNRAVASLEKERQWVTSNKGFSYVSGPWASEAAAFRSLAETRRVLEMFDDVDTLYARTTGTCPICGLMSRSPEDAGYQYMHAPSCIYATMPRPR